MKTVPDVKKIAAKSFFGSIPCQKVEGVFFLFSACTLNCTQSLIIFHNNKKFSDKTSLKDHEIFHTGDKPFSCTTSKKEFYKLKKSLIWILSRIMKYYAVATNHFRAPHVKNSEQVWKIIKNPPECQTIRLCTMWYYIYSCLHTITYLYFLTLSIFFGNVKRIAWYLLRK